MTFSGNRIYEEQTQNLLKEAKGDLDRLDIRMKELEKDKERLQKEVQALEMCLSIYLRRTGTVPTPSPTSDWRAILSGYKTHSERIKAVAENQGGEIDVSEVRDILFDNGLMESKTRSSAYVGVYNRIKELEEKGVLQQVSKGQGRYRLVNTQKALPITGARE
jgi:hypothetical protein